MARARPIKRPTWLARRGSFSGPSTTSAMTKISNTSEKPTSNMALDQCLQQRCAPQISFKKEEPTRLANRAL